MTLTLDTLAFLTTPTGDQLLRSLYDEDLSDTHHLRLLTRLRKTYAAEQASAALEMARLRLLAVEKFGTDAHRMFFTRDALEQASAPAVRRWRPSLLHQPNSTLVDVCCGIGSDALAFGAQGSRVTGIEIDPVRAALAQLNAQALNLPAAFITADARTSPIDAPAVFYDPARRDSAGRRLFDVEQYLPPLSLIRQWQYGELLAKLSPGVDLVQLAGYGGLVRFVSVGGELKEALLHLGGADAPGLMAVRLDGDQIDTQVYDPARDTDFVLDTPRGWLCEPDPAAIRAQLVRALAADCGGALLDESIAYFTTDVPPTSPWVRTWAIEAWLPFSVKRLREALRERSVGRVTVKKRGTAVTPETIIPQLKLKGDQERVVVLTRLRGQQISLICIPPKVGLPT